MKRKAIPIGILAFAWATLSATPLTVANAGPPGWSVTPQAYDYDGSISAAVLDGGAQTGGEGDTLGAFVGEECRGVAGAWETPIQTYVFPLTVYSNQASGESLSFRYYGASEDMVCDITERVEFAPDMTVGSLVSPFELNIGNRPPFVPDAPVPQHEETGLTIDTDLAWTAGDPDEGDSVIYIIYFGTDPVPLCHDTTEAYPADSLHLQYDLPVLDYDCTYYWMIVAEDAYGRKTDGGVWRFEVEPCAVEATSWSSIKSLYR
jgi:hypothetical protein